MKTKNKTHNKLILPAIGLTCIVLILGILALRSVRRHHAAPTPTLAGEPTAEQKKQAADVNAAYKKQTIEGGSNTSTQSSNQTGNDNDVSLTARQESNGTVTVFTKLTGITAGSCSLTVSNGSKSVTQTAEIIYQPEYSSCAGFSVPMSNVGVGTWELKLTITSNGKTTTKTITTEVH